MPAGIAIKAFWYHLIAWPVSAFIAMWPAIFKRFGVGVWTYVFNTVHPISDSPKLILLLSLGVGLAIQRIHGTMRSWGW